MTAKYTQGPWRYIYVSETQGDGEWKDNFWIRTDNRTSICSSVCSIVHGDYPSDCPEEEMRANASLIAAAPELLALVEEYREFMVDEETKLEMFNAFLDAHEHMGLKIEDRPPKGDPATEKLKEIDAVLAKAKGE